MLLRVSAPVRELVWVQVQVQVLPQVREFDCRAPSSLTYLARLFKEE